MSISVGGLLIHLDSKIRAKFEGKRWNLPAKVYARALDLYPGKSLSIYDLKIELSGLGYKFSDQAEEPGQATFGINRVSVFTRGFLFPDGSEESQKIFIEFAENQITGIQNPTGKTLSLVRLEPILVGGIYPKDNEDRDLIRLKQAPPHLINVLIYTEDRNYYKHHGISVIGMVRAFMENIAAGQIVQGGSTITQQLVKNFYLTSERTLWRKLIELQMAFLLDLHYTKDEILEAYLNEVYFGQEGQRAIHGIGLASQYYFAQPIQELKLHQVALLVGLIKGPSYFNPRNHPVRAKKRRDLVLNIMEQEGVISPKDVRDARAKPLDVVKEKILHKGGSYPAYLDLVKRQLRTEYKDEDLSNEGLKIFTSLDPIAQDRAEQSVVQTLNQLKKNNNKQLANLQASVVVSNPQSGEVLAIVGGRDARYQGFNRALDSARPIGSLIKPVIYLTALENGYTLASLLSDEPITIFLPKGKKWTPQNFDNENHGNVPLYRSLALSYNQATVRLGMEIGLDKVADMLIRLGMEKKVQLFPSLLLGSIALSPLEVGELYQSLSGNGFQTHLRAIRVVTTADNKELSSYPFTVQKQVAPEYMYLIQYALQKAAREGTGRNMYKKLPPELTVAGKTGTTNDQRDSWFAGFAGNRLAVVWLGRDDNHSLPLTGSSGALEVWTEFMRMEHPEPFVAYKPEKIIDVLIEPDSGLLANSNCDNVELMPFVQDTEPDTEAECAKSDKFNPFNWINGLFKN